MTTQSRYYSNLSQGSFITNVGGLSTSTSNLTVQATANWPTSFPFTVRFEPGTTNEEVALISSGAGTSGNPYIITQRGFDGTNPLTHSQGASVIPGFSQIDFAQPQQHLNLMGATSAAHGLPANAWSGGTMTLLDTVPYTSAVGTTISIPSIPTTGYNHLRIEYALRGNGTSSNGLQYVSPFSDPLAINFNGVTSSTYNCLVNAANESSSTMAVLLQSGTSKPYCGCIWMENPATLGMGQGWIDIPWYANTVGVKSFTFSGVATDGGADICTLSGAGSAGGSSNTNPITSIQLTLPSSASSTAFVAGNVWLYGIN